MMILFDYFLKTDDKYHDEVDRLIRVLENDLIDDEAEAEKEKAQERLDQLVKLSNKKGR